MILHLGHDCEEYKMLGSNGLNAGELSLVKLVE